MHPSSGQRTASPATAIGWKIVRASIVENDALIPPPRGCLHPMGTAYLGRYKNRSPYSNRWLRIEWKKHESNSVQQRRVTHHHLQWLYQCRYDRSSLQRLTQQTTIHPHNNKNNKNKDTIIRQDSTLVEVDYHDLMNDDDDDDDENSCLVLLQAIFEQGAALVRKAPTGDICENSEDMKNKTVAQVGIRLAGSLSHGQLYGNTFHVQSLPQAKNIAYTSTPLPPHQDLVYYQSPPGLQLLHCVENKASGGESTLVDALAAATQLQEWAPDLFDTLTTCCATFLKQRESADMVYRTPHIQVVIDDNSNPVVVAVRWAPPFQGPVSVEPERLQEYFAAYMALERMLDNSLQHDLYLSSVVNQELEQQLREYANEFTWEQRLAEGDILVFNNQRMLHGRRGFHLDGVGVGRRHFIGCYTNMEDTLNRYRLLLRRKQFSADNDSVGVTYQRITGNGSSGVLLL
jgi:gamma-butyrobetaine dioxygenase